MRLFLFMMLNLSSYIRNDRELNHNITFFTCIRSGFGVNAPAELIDL